MKRKMTEKGSLKAWRRKRDIYAKELLTQKYHQRVVPDAKKYDRNKLKNQEITDDA